MEKKNLLLIVPKLDQGGLERVCVRTARILSDRFRVTIAAFDPSDPAYDLTGLDVRDLRAPALKSRAGKVFRVLQRALRLRRLKGQIRADICYSFGPTANRANLLAGGRGKIWCGLRSWADVSSSRQLAWTSGRADEMICCSRALADRLREACPGASARVLYNPYNAAEIGECAARSDADLPDWDGCRVLISVGREAPVKGYWHLIKAFSLVHGKLPDTRLAIVGSGDFAGYRQLAKALGVGDAVCLPGLKKNPFPWLLRADLFVLTSLYEGFPNAMTEAMTLGCPVVATNCMTGPAEILTEDYRTAQRAEGVLEGEYGILVPPLDPEENLDPSRITAEQKRLAEVICGLLSDPEKLRAYGEAAKRRAADFGEEAYGDRFCRIAEGAVGD